MEHAVMIVVVGAAVAGVFGQWLGWRAGIPAIIPLLAIGALLGPIGGIITPSRALGEIMRPTIGMAVAIIVFEGGLNLNLRELRSAGRGIMRLVVVALPLNWVLGALAGHFAGGLSWPVATLFGSILVVTGPTVIMPLLRQAKLDPRSTAFLKWEAIVNDPIGATLTLLILSYVTLTASTTTSTAVATILLHAASGVAVSVALGIAVPFTIRAGFRRDLVPEYLKTPVLLAGALMIYAAGELVQPETGLIGATLCGVVLANIDIHGLQELRRFKESLTVFLVSGLFVLLTANIDRETVRMLSWPIAMTTLVILFVVRPIAILLATQGARMTAAERGLVAWIGPRGVVAAAVAGVAGQTLTDAGYADGRLLLPMVFAVIAATVLLHGLTLAPLARRLGLAADSDGGLMIVGASAWTVALGEALRGAGVPVTMMDRSDESLRPARLAGLRAVRGELLSPTSEDLAELRDATHLLAATPDDAYNALACHRCAHEMGLERVYQLAFAGHGGSAATARDWRGKIVGSHSLDFAKLEDMMMKGAAIVTEQVDAVATLVRDDDRRSFPIAQIVNGNLSFISPDAPVDLVPGARVLRLYQAKLAKTPTRRRMKVPTRFWRSAIPVDAA